MRTPLCTLFNFNYLDKGLVLYESLERVASDFVLYVLAMDDACYDYLQAQGYRYLIPVRLSDFENEALLQAKANRSMGEYCWTCSSSLIKYVLDHYGEAACAYIDADMCFYADPAILFEELTEKGGSVLLTGHRFLPGERIREKMVGHFCVEFNLFLNVEDARKALDVWIGQCLEKCSREADGITFGDQKYLDVWPEQYGFVRETQHPGVGVAPWNVAAYKLVSYDPAAGCCRIKYRGRETDLVFYHFEGIEYQDRRQVTLNLYRYWGIDDKLIEALYGNYLLAIEAQKQKIARQTGKEILLKSHPAFVPQGKASVSQRIRSITRKLSTSDGRKNLFGIEIPRRLYAAKDNMTF